MDKAFKGITGTEKSPKNALYATKMEMTTAVCWRTLQGPWRCWDWLIERFSASAVTP